MNRHPKPSKTADRGIGRRALVAAIAVLPITVAFIAITAPPASAAVPGSARLTFAGNGHQYQRIDQSITWTQAVAASAAMGGHLATITSAAENSFVQAMLPSRAWLGATDAATEGEWTWITGEAFSYGSTFHVMPWASAEPNNFWGPRSENYLETSSSSWNDMADWDYVPSYLVEWEDSAPTVTGIKPAAGPLSGGTAVTISGTGFTGATAVTFGSVPATSFTVNTDGTVTAVSPATGSPQTVDIRVARGSLTSTAVAADLFSYVFNFTGFLSPVANPPRVNQANAGQAIPMKFRLGGNFGLKIIQSGYPVSQAVDAKGTLLGKAEPAQNPGGAQLTFDPSTNTYSFVWKTNKLWKGTSRLFTMKLIDGTTHSAVFQFR